jgi:spermidine synthase
MALLLATQTAAALFALAFSQFAGNSQIFFAKLIYEFKENHAHLYLAKALLLFVFMLPPTFCLGATFPLVGKIYTRSLAHTGRSIGFAYAVNSVGAVLGSFCAGFLLIPFLGKENGLGLVIGAQLLTAVCVGFLTFRKAGVPFLRWSPLVLIGVLGVGLAFYFPHWDRKTLSKGKYHRFERSEIRNASWMKTLVSPKSVHFAEDEGEELVYYGDGIGGFTAVLKQDVLGDMKYILLNSGKPDASFPGDMATQVLSAHFPLLFHPAPKTVLVIGLASGITAGEVLGYPVERLDIVDINEKVVAASGYFREWNSDVLADGRTRLIIQDARAHLAMTNRMYDVISSEPSNPWMAGIASLFTRDFFESVRDHLNDGGIFVQFTHAYEMDWDVFAMIGRTFAEVFPNSILVNTDPTTVGGDYLLIGIKGAGKFDARVAAERLKYAQRSKNIELLDPRLFFSLIVSEDLRGLFGDGPVHTENHPYLEYAAPKLMFVDDPVIGQSVLNRKRLSKGTDDIVRELTADLDRRIDFAAYALSIYTPALAFRDYVDLSAATPAQRERLSGLLIDYCRQNVVRDVFLLRDEAVRDTCVAVQMDVVTKRMATAKDRGPYLKRLAEMSFNEGELDRALEYLSQAVTLNPRDGEAESNIGVILTRQGKYDDAVAHHKKAIGIDPNAATNYDNMGCTLAEQGKTAEALEYFSKALKRDPELVDAHYNIGNTLASEGRFDEAVQHFSTAVRLKPDLVEAHNNLGNTLLAQGRVGDAIAQFKVALSLRPDLALAHFGLGRALDSQGRTGEAIEHLSRCVALEPDFAAALGSLAWILATGSDAKYRDGARAVALAERACELTGYTHPLMLDALAAACAETGDFARATETARRAIAQARSAGQEAWAQDIGSRLELYDQGTPFRTVSP